MALEHHTDGAAVHRDGDGIDVVDQDGARVGRPEACDSSQKRGLAAAGWAKQGHNLAFRHGQRTTVEHGHLAKTVRRRMIWNSRADFGAEVIGSSDSSYAA